jgi:S1-C subfamily serine protease
VAQDDKEAIVLTAAHVVANESEIKIGTEAGKTYPGRVIYENRVLDLAAVVTLPVFTHVARMAPANDGYRFAPVMAYGFPALVGPDGHPTFGMLASERDTVRDCVADHNQPAAPCIYVEVKFWRITAPIFFGNSGGAVYVRDDKGWALIGVAQRVAGGGFSVAPHVGFISPPEPTRDAIRIALHLQEEVRRAAGK